MSLHLPNDSASLHLQQSLHLNRLQFLSPNFAFLQYLFLAHCKIFSFSADVGAGVGTGVGAGVVAGVVADVGAGVGAGVGSIVGDGVGDVEVGTHSSVSSSQHSPPSASVQASPGVSASSG